MSQASKHVKWCLNKAKKEIEESKIQKYLKSKLKYNFNEQRHFNLGNCHTCWIYGQFLF